MTVRSLASALAGLAVLSSAGSVLAQTPYGGQPYGGQPYGGTQAQQPADVFSSLLGALFGTNVGAETQVLDDTWGRGGRPLSDRRADLSARIDAGVRDGSLSRIEADRLRAEYDTLARVEANYSADGRITPEERQDLRARYQAFSQRLRAERADDGREVGQWRPLAPRTAEFDARVNASLQARDITRAEALRLRQDYQALVQLEAGYNRGGLDAREMADLNSRYDDFARRLGDDDRYGRDDARRWTTLEARLVAAERAGRVDRDDGLMLRAQLADLARLDIAYRNDGLNADERAYLDRRFQDLTARLPGGRR